MKASTELMIALLPAQYKTGVIKMYRVAMIASTKHEVSSILA